MSSTTIHNVKICAPILQLFDSQFLRFLPILEQVREIAPIAFAEIAIDVPENDIRPSWCQGFFTWLDALSLCAVLRLRNPSKYVEIGSGNSTRFARWCIERFGLRTTIISIDPEPRLNIAHIADEVYPIPVQQAPYTIFEQLRDGDLLFYDGSHELGSATDMTHVAYSIMPLLKKGVMIGMHDTYLPFMAHHMEDYFLGATLLGGSSYVVDFPTPYIASVEGLTRKAILALLDALNGDKIRTNHEMVFRQHSINIGADMLGCTFFLSKVND